MEKLLISVRQAAAIAGPLLLLLLVLNLQLPVQVSGDSPPPGSVKIESLSYGGSGCPPGTVEGALSTDTKAVTLMFSNYIAKTDGSLKDRKKECIVSVGLKYPPGFVLAVAEVTLRGYAKLDRGTSGSIQTWYYFSGLPGTARVRRSLPAPFDSSFEFTDKLATFVYSRCGLVRNLNLASEAKVHPGSPRKGNALINIDSVDFAVSQVWRLTWKRC